MLHAADWSEDQRRAVQEAFRGHYSSSLAAGRALAASCDPEEAFRSIESGAVQAVIADGYVIVYDFGQMWHSPVQVLFEELILRLPGFPPGNLSRAIEVLEKLAALHDCAAVAAGNGIGRRGLSGAYERAGYRPVAVRLYKEMQ